MRILYHSGKICFSNVDPELSMTRNCRVHRIYGTAQCVYVHPFFTHKQWKVLYPYNMFTYTINASMLKAWFLKVFKFLISTHIC